jgi:LPS sulfotransferase NodH
MRAIAECFPDGPGPALGGFDWRAHGIDRPYVIFITGRCGSALLTGMLAQTRLCGVPDEYFNESRGARLVPKFGAATFAEYFGRLVEHAGGNRRFGVVLDPFRFPAACEMLDFGSVFPAQKTEFFWLTRRDLVAQAWSFAKAKRSGLWHVYADGGEERSDPPDADLAARAGISDPEWWRELIYILHGEQRLEQYFAETGIAPHRLDYETLIAEKTGTVAAVLRALGCAEGGIAAALPVLADTTRRHRYADWGGARASFSVRYAAELKEVTAARRTIDLGELWQALAARHAIKLWD